MGRISIGSTIALMAGVLLTGCATRPPVAATLDALTLRAPEQPVVSPRGIEMALQIIAYDNAADAKRLWVACVWRELNPNATPGGSRRNMSSSDSTHLARGQILSLPLPTLVVRARNLSGQPLRVSLDQFALRDAHGRRYQPFRSVAEIQAEVLLRLESPRRSLTQQTHDNLRDHIARLPLLVSDVELEAGGETAALIAFRLGIRDLREQHDFLSSSGALVLEITGAGAGSETRVLTIPLKTTRAPVKVLCASGTTQPSFEDCQLEQ